MDHAYDIPTAIPAIRVHAGSASFDITNVEEALAFARANPHRRGDYEGLIRRLQSATDPDDIAEAGNAFMWWAQSNGLIGDREH